MKSVLAAVLLIGACAGPQSEPRSVVAAHPAPPSAVSLLTSIHDLEAPNRDADHTRVLTAFQALGEALQIAAPGRTNEILRVKASCNALERSVTNVHARADFVRIGLTAATDALSAVAPSDPNVVAMAQATQNIDPDKTLSEQYAQVRAALHASVLVVYAVEGASEPR